MGLMEKAEIKKIQQHREALGMHRRWIIKCHEVSREHPEWKIHEVESEAIYRLIDEEITKQRGY